MTYTASLRTPVDALPPRQANPMGEGMCYFLKLAQSKSFKELAIIVTTPSPPQLSFPVASARLP